MPHIKVLRKWNYIYAMLKFRATIRGGEKEGTVDGRADEKSQQSNLASG
jgi:hypothetical protein